MYMSATMVHLALFPDVVVLSSVVGKVDRSSCWCYVFVAMCLVNLLLSTILLFLSVVCVVHMYHVTLTTLSAELKAKYRGKQLTEAVGVFQRYTATCHLKDWLVMRCFSGFLLGGWFLQKTSWNHPDKPQKWCFGVWKRYFISFPIYGYVRYFYTTLLSLISIEGPVVKF